MEKMKRDRTLDLARSMAMLYIIGIWHLVNYTEMYVVPYGEYITYSVLGLFMFISGFLLSGKYQIVDFKSTFLFFKKRVVRILPLFFLAISSYCFWGSVSWKTALYTVSGLSTLFPPQMGTLWFVSMVLLFYILYPLLWSRKNVNTILVGIVIWSVFYCVDCVSNSIDMRFFYYFPCFVTGMVIAKMDLYKIITSLKAILMSCVLFFIVSILLLKMELNELLAVWGVIIVALSGLLLILACSYRIAKHVNSYMVQYIAYASMAAYMFHRQIWSIIRYIYWPEDGVGRLLFLIFICLPLILAAGYLIQYSYDKLILLVIKYANSLHRK